MTMASGCSSLWARPGAAAAALLCLAFLPALPAAGQEVDSDHDGFDDAFEQQIGTDPRDPASRPTLADSAGKIAAYWPLASNAVEATGAGPDGVLRNGAGFGDRALVLDGYDGHVNFGSTLSVTGSLSYALWLRPERMRGLTRLLGKFQVRNKSREYCAFDMGDGRLWLFVSDDGSSANGHFILKRTRAPVVRSGRWLHLAVAWDAARGSSGMACYTNGVETELVDALSGEIESIHSGAADLTLGTYDVISSKVGQTVRDIVFSPFEGQIAGLVLCRGALSGLEARELFALGRTGDVAGYLEADRDGDGLPDWWERLYFGDVTARPEADPDGDGFTNYQEFIAGTDPADAGGGDRDGDGLPDAWEMRMFGNLAQGPADDPDGDGWNNGLEFKRGGHPLRVWTPDAGNRLQLQVSTPLRRGI